MMVESEGCCDRCYRTKTTGNTPYFLTNDDNSEGLKTTIMAAFIPDNKLRFLNTYRLDLNQLSISADAYRFLRLVKQHSEIWGQYLILHGKYSRKHYKPR
jgi:hypothetical protein